MHQVIVALVTIIVLSFAGALTAEVKFVNKIGPPFNSCDVIVSGEIDAQTPQQTEKLLTQYKCTGFPSFYVNSGGGDVTAAMEVGKIIRRVKGMCMCREESSAPVHV
jgi:hypothetical protein